MSNVCLDLRRSFSRNMVEERKWKKTLNEVIRSTRKFVNVRFSSMEHRENDVLEVLKVFSATFKSICFHWCRLDAQRLSNMLGDIPHLETFVVRLNSSFQYKHDFEAVELKNLKHVTLSMCNWDVVKVMKSSRVVTIEVKDYINGKLEHFKHFLSTQTKLETIEICAFLTLVKLFEIDMSATCPSAFQLKKFSLLCKSRSIIEWLESDKNFIKFFRLHGQRLQELELDCQLSRDMLKFIVTELKSLRKLTLNVSFLPSGSDFYSNLSASSNITELILRDEFRCNVTGRAFFGMFEHVEKLTLPCVSGSLLRYIQRNYYRLSSLTLANLPHRSINDPIIYIDNEVRPSGIVSLLRHIDSVSMQWLNRSLLKLMDLDHLRIPPPKPEPYSLCFPRLKQLRIESITDIENFVWFIKENPTIERLSIMQIHFSIVTSLHIQAMLEHTRINHIQAKGDRRSMKWFFQAVKECNWNKLRTMELIVRNPCTNTALAFFFSMPNHRESTDNYCPVCAFVWV